MSEKKEKKRDGNTQRGRKYLQSHKDYSIASAGYILSLSGLSRTTLVRFYYRTIVTLWQATAHLKNGSSMYDIFA